MKLIDKYYWFGAGAGTFAVPWMVYLLNFLYLELQLINTIVISLFGLTMMFYILYLKSKDKKK